MGPYGESRLLWSLRRAGLRLGVPALAGLAASLGAQPVERGPLPVRDGQVLAQGRLGLPAESAVTLAPGQSRWRVGLLWANTFAWTQDVPGEAPRVRRFLLDGETFTLDAGFEHGLRPGLELALRLPLHLRGGGVMDGLLDALHRTFGLDDGSRPAFRRDAWRVEGLTPAGRSFAWPAGQAALGDLELGLRRSLAGPGPARAALVARLGLPTSTGPLRERRPALGLQLVAARDLGASAVLQGGVGGLLGGTREVAGVAYEAARGQAFLALERRLGRRASLHLQADLASRLVAGLDRYPGLHSHALLGLSRDLGATTRLELALIENLRDQQATADLALHAAVTVRPGP